MLEIKPTQLSEVELLPELERSAGKAFLAMPELAFVANGDVVSEAEHERFVGLDASWVAHVNGQCCGFVCAEVFGAELHVWELAVHADAQKQGIGAALMAQIVEHAHKAGLAAVTLTTFRDVAFNAPFYKRLGFDYVEGEVLAQDARLQDVLLAEAAHGLPAQSRCAMRLLVANLTQEGVRSPGSQWP